MFDATSHCAYCAVQVHAVEPSTLVEYATHVVHVMPAPDTPFEKVPAGQKHCVAEDAPAGPTASAGQAVQELAPVKFAYELAAQGVHVAACAEVCAVGPKEPAAQGVPRYAEKSGPDVYVPEGAATAAAPPPAHTKPAAHATAGGVTPFAHA